MGNPWTGHENSVIVAAMLDGQTPEQAAKQLTDRTATATRNRGNALRAGLVRAGEKAPGWPRARKSPDWEALKALVRGHRDKSLEAGVASKPENGPGRGPGE